MSLREAPQKRTGRALSTGLNTLHGPTERVFVRVNPGQMLPNKASELWKAQNLTAPLTQSGSNLQVAPQFYICKVPLLKTKMENGLPKTSKPDVQPNLGMGMSWPNPTDGYVTAQSYGYVRVKHQSNRWTCNKGIQTAAVGHGIGFSDANISLRLSRNLELQRART